jgi:hypothetical protein
MMIAPLKFIPVAGYVLNIDNNAVPGKLSKEEKKYLRGLVKRVLEISNSPVQQDKKKLWFEHNDLKKTRPISLVFPENSWREILPVDSMKVKDPFWKQWEWYFRHLIYRSEYIDDDFVIEPDIYVSPMIDIGDWGMQPVFSKTQENGSYRWEPPLKNPDDIVKLKIPEVKIDENSTKKSFDVLNEVFGDLAPVRTHYGPWTNTVSIIWEAVTLRGVEQLMLDIYDRPEWLHKLMNFITEGYLKRMEYFEDNGYLRLNNRNHYVDSGGIGYNNELPSNSYDGKKVHLRDMWGFGISQEASDISPVQHEEFVLNYQMRILKYFGLNSYGCCEPLTHKFDMVKKIPRLRRVSVSPWCDVNTAAEQLEDKYIYAWKPNPIVIVGRFDEHEIREYVRNTLHTARNCVLEIIMKDTITLNNNPDRIAKWCSIIREEIENI